MLTVTNLTRRFGSRTAVDDLSLTIGRGERFGLLGPNGAGKTTLLSMIVGALAPDRGSVTLDGASLQGEAAPARRRLGYVPQEIALYDDLSAAQNLRFFGSLYGLAGPRLRERTAICLEQAGLADRAKSVVRTFSGGMKRRLNLAAALLHEPELLLLDEPTAGVDPQSRNALFEQIERLCGEGVTLLYTTHYLEEVERLCERIAVLDHGRLLALGTIDELRALLPGRDAPLRFTLTAEDIARLLGTPGSPGIEALQAALAARGIAPLEVATQQPGLEEVFLYLTGKELRDA